MIQLILLATGALAASNEVSAPNPIRQVVTMLQSIQKKISDEGDAEKVLFDKFMCYTKKTSAPLEDAVNQATTGAPQAQAEIDRDVADLARLKTDVAQAKQDRDAAKTAIDSATAMRSKQASDFAAHDNELSTSLTSVSQALTALNASTGKSFLQSEIPQLKVLVDTKLHLMEQDRKTILSFLDANSTGPASGEVIGVLKQIGDTMQKDQDSSRQSENSSVQMHQDLIAAKQHELDSYTASIESKMTRIGELGVLVVTKQAELKDSTASLTANQKLLAELQASADAKQKDWDLRSQTRAQELATISETIAMLSQDDSLDTFNKAKSAFSPTSLLQGEQDLAQKARTAIKEAIAQLEPGMQRAPLDLISIALTSKGVDFKKVVVMVDNMIDVMKQEQVHDTQKKEWCGKEFNDASFKKQGFTRSVTEESSAIDALKVRLAANAGELDTLKQGTSMMDTMVAQATDQRKAENAKFQELMTSDAAAKNLLGVAVNRLNQFYNPDMVVTTTTNSPYFLQVSSVDAPISTAPATYGEIKVQSQSSNKVVSLLMDLSHDLDMEMQEAQSNENEAQKDYESMLADAAAKRQADGDAATHLNSEKADIEMDIQNRQQSLDGNTKQAQANDDYIMNLHKECDWLAENHDRRAQARLTEMDSLNTAKATLLGANFDSPATTASLLQVSRRNLLRGVRAGVLMP